MRSLHVAALPFPAPRGTQAALDAVLRALNSAGHPASLFCYPEHAAVSRSHAYPVQRVARLRGPHTTDSGPSWAKIKLDLGLFAQLAALVRREQPDVVVAHHVEAALCCLHLSRPVLFYAHTSLRTELPTYFGAVLHRPLALAGEALDSFLCRRFAGALAVSPLLSEQLSAQSGASVSALPLPWELPEPTSDDERARAREALGFSASDLVLLYAGNLDAYQGVEALLAPLARLKQAGRAVRFLVATETAPPASFVSEFAQAGLAACIHFAQLGDEACRRRVHAAADLSLVPRRAAGGLPIKLLDALARGVPVVTTPRACAGLPLSAPAVEVVSEEADAWARGILRALSRPRAAASVAGRAYIAEQHAPQRFAQAFVGHVARTRLA